MFITLFTSIVHIFDLLFTTFAHNFVHNFCSKLLLKISVKNTTTFVNKLSRDFVCLFSPQLFSQPLITNLLFNFYSELLSAIFYSQTLFTSSRPLLTNFVFNFLNKFFSQILFTTFVVYNISLRAFVNIVCKYIS